MFFFGSLLMTVYFFYSALSKKLVSMVPFSIVLEGCLLLVTCSFLPSRNSFFYSALSKKLVSMVVFSIVLEGCLLLVTCSFLPSCNYCSWYFFWVEGVQLLMD